MRNEVSHAAMGLAFGALLAVLAPCSGAQAWTETVLHAFTGDDGAYPQSTLIMDAQGNLYGTTREGGIHCGHGCGTVFKITPDGHETVLYAFQGATDGVEPLAGVVMDADGNLYGTTSQGGAFGCKCGTVYKLTPQGAHTILHAFQHGEGQDPSSGLVMDQAGDIYGTTALTDGCEVGGCGTVFKIAAGGDYSTVYFFKGGADGSSPGSTPVFDLNGNLYGTTTSGGRPKCSQDKRGCGTVYRLAPDGTETILYAFRGGHDGKDPYSTALIFDAAGDLYGTTLIGGGSECILGIGCGTVFKLAPDGRETVLSTFNRAVGPNRPTSGVVMDGMGNLLGTTSNGGTAGCGTVFKVSPGKKAKAIYSFTCKKDGADPEAGLLIGNDGTLYGTTVSGGNGFGVVYALRET